MNKCKNCGTLLLKDTRFCTHCGAKQKMSKGKLILIIIGILNVFFLFGLMSFGYLMEIRDELIADMQTEGAYMDEDALESDLSEKESPKKNPAEVEKVITDDKADKIEEAQGANQEIIYKLYEDEYLSYEIPSDWEVLETYFDDVTYGITFASSTTSVHSPSNVYVEIVDVNDYVEYETTDYGDEEIQESYYDFVINELLVDYPEEAAAGEILTMMMEDHYVYTFHYEVEVDGQQVRQGIYAPMSYEYPIMIYATEWSDGENPTVDQVTEHIIKTLQINFDSIEWTSNRF